MVARLLEQAKFSDNTYFLVQALTALGNVFVVTGRFSKALEVLFEAQEKLDETVPDEDRAILHDHIGVAYGNSGLLEEALYHYEQARQLSSVPRNRLRFEMHAALIHGNLGRWDETKKVFLEASLSGRELLGEHEWYRCQKSLIHIAFQIAQNKNALNQDLHKIQEQAEAFLQEITNTAYTILQVETLDILSSIHTAQNQHQLAFMYVSRALELVKTLHAPRSEIVILWHLAMTQTSLARLDQAIETLNTALRLSEHMGGKGLAAQLNHQLSVVLEQSGQYQAALKHYQIFHSLDSEKKSLVATARATALMTRVRLEQAELKAEFEQQQSSQLRDMNLKLETMVRTDALTGLANRRALNENLEQMFALASREQITFSFAMLDLDFFKRINDQFSHTAGDAVLVRTAQILREQCRSSDTIARFGGEEFAIIFSGMVGTGTQLVCERIRLAFLEHNWNDVHPNFRNQNIEITMSIGVCDQPQSQAEQWLVKADQALYRAKNSGRNQVCFAQ